MVPTFANEILYQITETAKLGNREYEVVLFDDDRRYRVCEEIASELRLLAVVVQVNTYHSPGSYGDGGEEFIKAS